MGKHVQQEQQFVTAVIPWIYVVVGLFLFEYYRHWVLLATPLLLLMCNPVILRRASLLTGWKARYVYVYSGCLLVSSTVMIVFSGSYQSLVYPVGFFVPLGYAALFLSRSGLTLVLLVSTAAVLAIYFAADGGFAETTFIDLFMYVDLILFAFVIVVCRLLYAWSRHARQYRLLSLMKGDRNNPENQLRLNMLFGGVFLLLHVIQWLVVRDVEMLPVFVTVAVLGSAVWMAASYALYVNPGYSQQPLIVLTLVAFCTASIAFSGFADSLLFPGLYLLPVMFISFNTSRRIGTGTGLLSLMLSVLVFSATRGTDVEHMSRLLLYGILFFFLPQVIGYTIRAQMHLLKQGSLEQKVEWHT